MIENLLYTALATLLVIVLLHIGVFWVSRVIQPPKPRVVYMPQPQPQYNTLPPPVLQQLPMQPLPQSIQQTQPTPPAPLAAPEIKLPTYDTPPTKPVPPALPPPIETRDPARS
uniref:Uncharacterized protein n=1 Tax=viral metagenome TaxID=1070528 RepID=A0A6C0HLY6_9ZZZZ